MEGSLQTESREFERARDERRTRKRELEQWRQAKATFPKRTRQRARRERERERRRRKLQEREDEGSADVSGQTEGSTSVSRPPNERTPEVNIDLERGEWRVRRAVCSRRLLSLWSACAVSQQLEKRLSIRHTHDELVNLNIINEGSEKEHQQTQQKLEGLFVHRVARDELVERGILHGGWQCLCLARQRPHSLPCAGEAGMEEVSRMVRMVSNINLNKQVRALLVGLRVAVERCGLL